MEKGNKKIITAWTFYDWANSVYNLVITATILPIYYKAVTVTKDVDGKEISNVVTFLGMQFKNTTLYDYSLAFANLVVAAIIPLLSGIADYGGSKKKFMQFFCYLGATSCSLMYFFTRNNLELGIILVVLACIGFWGSLVFYNAFLPEIAKPAHQIPTVKNESRVAVPVSVIPNQSGFCTRSITTRSKGTPFSRSAIAARWT